MFFFLFHFTSFIHYFPVFVIPKPIKVEVSVIGSRSADGHD